MLDKKDAFKIWEMEMGNKEYAHDFSGRKIKKRTMVLITKWVG